MRARFATPFEPECLAGVGLPVHDEVMDTRGGLPMHLLLVRAAVLTATGGHWRSQAVREGKL